MLAKVLNRFECEFTEGFSSRLITQSKLGKSVLSTVYP